jgi:hypothetical protein
MIGVGTNANVMFGAQRRHHHQQHIPEQHFQTSSLDIDVVTLVEIKEEYALILARLDALELGQQEGEVLHLSLSSIIT